MLKGRSAQTNRSKRPGRGRSKPLRRGNQTKAMTADGIMGRVHGSRRDPRKDKYGKISRRYRRHNWKDCHLESIPELLVPWRRESRDGRKDRNPVEIDQVEIDQAKYSTSPKGEGEIALWLRASSIEIAWRGPMLNVGLVLPRSRGFGDSVWHSNAEMGLHRTDVWRCLLSPLGREEYERRINKSRKIGGEKVKRLCCSLLCVQGYIGHLTRIWGTEDGATTGTTQVAYGYGGA
ncbi:hypothetical protein Acr_28g0005890 [Actinidia rufa]|uniref:Uncharacterized protein n=1 Tax=Actinidia rufa TaxID=165716 RepID=A0A7J0HAV1_9ERIC|nr:hypothetical protein Acr_28g0005890 [Actinidia rufa]